VSSFTVATTMMVSVAEFRRFAQIEGNEYDHLNQLLWETISGNTYRLWDRLGGDVTEQTYNEFQDAVDWDQDYIVPKHLPVTQVVAMTLHVPGVSDTAVAAADRWNDDIRIGIVERFMSTVSGRYADVSYFGKGRLRVHVCYKAGYSAERLRPLKLAVNAETAAWLNRQGYEGVAKAKEGDGSFEYDKSGWCHQAESIIRNWSA
jgi:hypothetical protein